MKFVTGTVKGGSSAHGSWGQYVRKMMELIEDYVLGESKKGVRV